MAITPLERKAATEVPAGEFTARIYLVNGAPDADGDRILADAIADGHKVKVSLGEHDVMTSAVEPAGEAELHHAAGAVVALGRIFDTARGAQLRAKLAANAGRQEWSIGYAIVSARAPTPAELAAHPDLKRIIVRWNPIEISPVSRGACGPTCRTLTAEGAAKGCAGPCCAVGDDRAAALQELARFEHTRYRIRLSDMKHRKAQWDAEAATERARDATDAEQAILEAHEVKSLDVPVELRVVAAAALERASEVLGGPRPPVRWFSPAAISAVKAVGMWLQGHIWLAVVTDPEELYNTVAHEVHHALKGSGETAATTFATKLSLLRGVEIHVGACRDFEDRLVQGRPDPRWKGTYLAPPTPRLELVRGLRAGALVAEDGVLFERVDVGEDLGWCRVADLIPA